MFAADDFDLRAVLMLPSARAASDGVTVFSFIPYILHTNENNFNLFFKTHCKHYRHFVKLTIVSYLKGADTMNAATDYAAKYTQKAMDAYIAYADTTDTRNAALYLDRARHYEVLAAAEKEKAARPVAVQAPAAKVEAPKVSAVESPSKARCPHYKLIKRFMAIARENGLDTSTAAKPQMRHAMESAMKRCVNSRSEVRADEWQMMGDLIKAGRLAW